MNKFRSWCEYKGVIGFLDLRKYIMTKKEFNSFWNLQEYLKSEQDKYLKLNKENQKANINHWNRLKVLSLQYRESLLTHCLKKGETSEI